MYLLDTNVLSELRKTTRADRNVVAWASGVPTAALFISVVTIFELERGVLLAERRDAVQGAALRVWLSERVLPAFEARTLSFDIRTALRCARMHIPDPRPERDAMIAACAMEHGFTVVTRNVKDFESTGVTLLDPWRAN